MKVYVDNYVGFRGRVIVALVDELGNELDRELVLKFPFGLRIRCWLAACRIRARQRKLAKINKKKV